MSRYLQQWWTGSNEALLVEAERRLLSSLVRHKFVKPLSHLDQEQKFGGINVVEFRSRSSAAHGFPDSLPTVLLTHGYGSGLGFFYQNIDALLRSNHVSRVVCLDWLGMGGSARPYCWESPIRSFFFPPSPSSRKSNHSQHAHSGLSFCNSKFTPTRAVDFFLDPLDRFLRSNFFSPGEPLWLVGHSLGGYLSARYAMRLCQPHPDFANDLGADDANSEVARRSNRTPNITKLVLASPVGFQPLPDPEDRPLISQLPPSVRLLDVLWSANVTPMGFVRALGEARGKEMVRRTLRGRIPQLDQSQQSELDLLANYLYHITVAPASGEYAMNSLLEPAVTEEGAGVFAREPLGGGALTSSIHSLGAERKFSIKEIKVLFGDNDWMRFHEPAARREMLSLRETCGIKASVHVVPGAGHHLYLDNHACFAEHILNA